MVSIMIDLNFSIIEYVYGVVVLNRCLFWSIKILKLLKFLISKRPCPEMLLVWWFMYLNILIKNQVGYVRNFAVVNYDYE